MSPLRFQELLPRARKAGVLAVLLAGTALAGCQTTSNSAPDTPPPGDPQVTGSIAAPDAAPDAATPNKNETIENTKKWAKYWNENQDDPKAAISYAAHLNAIGSADKALSVLRKTSISNPENGEILTAYGRQLAKMGQMPEANKVLYKATAVGKPDWKLYSVHGTVLDRLGKHKEARARYKSALQLEPNKKSVLNNLAMSHALSGDPKTAEGILLKAIANNRGKDNQQLQQNLALVLGLQGKFKQARNVLAKVLPAHLVEANMEYIKGLISQPNTWKQIETAQPANG